jgi:hypothetical protein
LELRSSPLTGKAPIPLAADTAGDLSMGDGLHGAIFGRKPVAIWCGINPLCLLLTSNHQFMFKFLSRGYRWFAGKLRLWIIERSLDAQLKDLPALAGRGSKREKQCILIFYQVN